MIWIEGGLLYAIEEALKWRALLLVFIDSEDEESFRMRALFDDPLISSLVDDVRCVPVRIQVGSVIHETFANHFSARKAPAIFFITANGKVEALIEGTVGLGELADCIAPLVNRSGSREPAPSPVSMIVDEIIGRTSMAATGTTSHYALHNELHAEDPTDCRDEQGKPCQCGMEDMAAKIELPPCFGCGDKPDMGNKTDDGQCMSVDDAILEDILCAPDALPKLAVLFRMLSQRVVQNGEHEDDQSPSADDSAEAKVSRISPSKVTSNDTFKTAGDSRAALNEGVGGAASRSSNGALQERVDRDVQNPGQRLEVSLPTPIRRKVVSESYGNFGATRKSQYDAKTKSTSTEGVLPKALFVADTSAASQSPHFEVQDAWPPKDVLIDEQPARRTNLTASRSKKKTESMLKTVTLTTSYSREFLTPVNSPLMERVTRSKSSTLRYERLQETDDESTDSAPTDVRDVTIVFKLPDESYLSKSFPRSAYLGDVRWDIEGTLCSKFERFFPLTFVRTQPYGEFMPQDYRQTLKDLKLRPYSVVLVVTRSSGAADCESRATNTAEKIVSRFFVLLWLAYNVMVKPLVSYLWSVLAAP